MEDGVCYDCEWKEYGREGVRERGRIFVCVSSLLAAPLIIQNASGFL